jgi:hypothetical protein
MGRRTSFHWKAIPGVLALSGCVAGATGPSPTDPHGSTTPFPTATTTTAAVAEDLASFRSCLGELGVVIEEIPVDALGRPIMARALSPLDLTDAVVADAVRQCAPHLSAGALDLSADPELRDLVVGSLQELARCVRLQGVTDFPDPIPGFDGRGSPFPTSRIPWDDPRLGPAVASCSGGPDR